MKPMSLADFRKRFEVVPGDDLTAREPIPVGATVDSTRLQKGLSILHASYQQLR